MKRRGFFYMFKKRLQEIFSSRIFASPNGEKAGDVYESKLKGMEKVQAPSKSGIHARYKEVEKRLNPNSSPSKIEARVNHLVANAGHVNMDVPNDPGIRTYVFSHLFKNATDSIGVYTRNFDAETLGWDPEFISQMEDSIRSNDKLTATFVIEDLDTQLEQGKEASSGSASKLMERIMNLASEFNDRVKLYSLDAQELRRRIEKQEEDQVLIDKLAAITDKYAYQHFAFSSETKSRVELERETKDSICEKAVANYGNRARVEKLEQILKALSESSFAKQVTPGQVPA